MCPARAVRHTTLLLFELFPDVRNGPTKTGERRGTNLIVFVSTCICHEGNSLSLHKQASIQLLAIARSFGRFKSEHASGD